MRSVRHLPPRRAGALIRVILAAAATAYLIPLLFDVFLWVASSRPHPGDNRSSTEVTDELRRNGIAAGQIYTPFSLRGTADGFVADGVQMPILSGLGNRRIVFCNESGAWATYDADRYGFNNPAQAWQDLGPTLVVIGDSYAQGACVAQNAGIAAHLRERGWSVLNLGVAGATPLRRLAILQEFGVATAPCVVVWLSVEGVDLHNVDGEAPELLRDYLQPGFRRGVMAASAAKDAVLERIESEGRQAAAPSAGPSLLATAMSPATWRSWAKLQRTRLHLASRGLGAVRRGDTVSADTRPLKEILVAAAQTAHQAGAQPVLVHLPTFLTVTTGTASPAQRSMQQVAGKVGIEWVDAAPRLIAHADPASLFPRRRPNHFTAEGYALIADAIAATVAPYMARCQ